MYKSVRCKYPRQHCTPHWWLTLGWPGSRCLHDHRYQRLLPTEISRQSQHTQVHDVIPANRTIVNDDIYEDPRERFKEDWERQLCYLPHAQSATAFHYR